MKISGYANATHVLRFPNPGPNAQAPMMPATAWNSE